jgi:hypothetical protein
MAKAVLKTKQTRADVGKFLAAVADEGRVRDARIVKKIIERATGWQPRMWGASIVGYGRYQYKYASGREGEYFVTGFSPRKNALTVYVMLGFSGYGDLMERLGKYKTSVSCLYIKSLDNIDLDVLEELISRSTADMKRTYPVTAK